LLLKLPLLALQQEHNEEKGNAREKTFVRLRAGKLPLPKLESTSSTKELQTTQNTNVAKNLLELGAVVSCIKYYLGKSVLGAFSTQLQAMYPQAKKYISFHLAFSLP